MKNINLKCPVCKNDFRKNYSIYKYESKINKKRKFYCSNACTGKSRGSSKYLKCQQCNKTFKKNLNQIKKTKNHFCTRSCAVTYNNTHKQTGTRRSKLEKWIEEQLLITYPNLLFKFNKKDDINSELDIFIPSLNLAFELNGIFHYEPIFGKTLLEKMENNDQRKIQACLEKNIELCIIDTSGQTYFKTHTSQKYLDIITSIINSKIALEGFEPSPRQSLPAYTV